MCRMRWRRWWHCKGRFNWHSMLLLYRLHEAISSIFVYGRLMLRVVSTTDLNPFIAVTILLSNVTLVIHSDLSHQGFVHCLDGSTLLTLTQWQFRWNVESRQDLSADVDV